MIYTGPIDYFFDYKFGKLPYRSIRFEWENFNWEYYQSVAQINFVTDTVKFTRVVEHKRLSDDNHKGTTVSFEYANSENKPYYPIPNEANHKLYKRYFEKTKSLKNIIFYGRLAEYQYYNTNQVVADTLKLCTILKR